ncbi:peptidyl-prolyl cis-trans isomerase C [Thermodesulfobium acidiphilum]|uniref:Peptidyl-prolyl cis-trans isomerase C n=1 Tax=Thermodesulfobium acidiphilum TaxID=1794699 RepID=A0A2R4VZ41_THEAF|nr:SurA N-terminal domain-containing protein [Thermodesulfobium acidiphilum]AWB09738.1 peptidyl-prolyl cis-trans isomerase C [Thermodesulfobium acidiphilum]
MKRIFFLCFVILFAVMARPSFADDKVLATVNGTSITQSQVDAVYNNLPPNVDKTNPDLKKEILNRLIDNLVLLDEAKKEGLEKDPNVIEAINNAKNMILINYLLQKHFAGQNFEVTDADVTNFYNQNSDKFKDKNGNLVPIDKVKDYVKQYLISQKEQQAYQAYVDSLKKQDNIVINQ